MVKVIRDCKVVRSPWQVNTVLALNQIDRDSRARQRVLEIESRLRQIGNHVLTYLPPSRHLP